MQDDDRRTPRDNSDGEKQPLLPRAAVVPPIRTVSASPPAAAAAVVLVSRRELLAAILALSGPISLTTVVEFLPQILISAMVGHSNPETALSLHDHRWPSDQAGALLETYGLATLVYSTAAFSLVYGFICGLDSVASCSFGMTVDAANCDEATLTLPSDSSSKRSASPKRLTVAEHNGSARRSSDVSGLGPHASGRPSGEARSRTGQLRNQARAASSAVAWSSATPVRGVVANSPVASSLLLARSVGRRNSAEFSSHSMGALRRSPSSPERLTTPAVAAAPTAVVTASTVAPTATATKCMDIVGSNRSSPSGRPYGSFPPPSDHSPRSTARRTAVAAVAAGAPPPVPLTLPRKNPSWMREESGDHDGEDSGLSEDEQSNQHHATTEAALTDEQRIARDQEEERLLLSLNGVVKQKRHPDIVVSNVPKQGTPPPQLPSSWRSPPPVSVSPAGAASAPPAVPSANHTHSSTHPHSHRQVSFDLPVGMVSVQPSPTVFGMGQLEMGSGAIMPSFPHAAPATPVEMPFTHPHPHHAHQPPDAKHPRPPSPPSPASPMPSSLIGLWIARCLMLEMVVVITLIVLLHWGTEPLLVALGEPAESIPVATAYVTAASWGLPFVAIYHSLNKGLQSSGVVLPVLLISVITKGICLCAVYVALYHMALNLVAVAWILSATMAGQAFAVYAYMRATGIAETWWGGPSSPSSSSSSGAGMLSDAVTFSWSGLWEYSVLAFPACVAICLEFWLFDLLGALAGLLPEPSTELAVHYLLFTATLASYMVFSGLSVSVSVLVGQKLGCAGQSENAKRSAIVGTSACLCVSALLMLLISLFHDTLARALTSQTILLERFAECVPVLVAYQAVDGLNTCSTQLLRTLGVQKYGVLLHFTTYYVLGISSSVFLAFHCGLGVMGLWIGLCFGVGLNASFATVWLWRYADWDQQSTDAQNRAAAMAGACGDTPAAYLSTSDSFVGEVNACCTPNSTDGATHEHHGN